MDKPESEIKPAKKIELGGYDEILRSCVTVAPPAAENGEPAPAAAADLEMPIARPRPRARASLSAYLLGGVCVLQFLALCVWGLLASAGPKLRSDAEAAHDLRQRLGSEFQLALAADKFLEAAGRTRDPQDANFKHAVQNFNEALCPTGDRAKDEAQSESFLEQNFLVRGGAIEYLDEPPLG